jgi:hypothetical protein
VSAARLSVTPRGAPGPVVVRDRAWLVSDALVVSRLSTHAVLPVRDVALQRGARAVAFALGLLALPDAGPASIAAVDLVLDAEQLGERIALPPSAIGEAFRALWVADVLRHGSAPGMARFADDLVPETSLAYALRWSVVTERLLDRSGEGSLAAVMLFRLLLDRVSHPHAPAALPASLVAEQLGLSEDQSRRGMKALLQRELLVEQPHAGRAKQYLLAPGVLVGQPGEGSTAPSAGPLAAVAPTAFAVPGPAPAAMAAAGGTAALAAPLGAPVPLVSPAAPLTAAAVPAGAVGPILEFAGQRIELPAQAELSVAIPGTRVAGMRLDAATGRLVVVLEPAQ